VPELPEVEAVRRIMERVLVGKKICAVEVAADSIVLKGAPPAAIESAILGRTVTAVGRKGKYWWLEFQDHPWLYGHLGMSGWVRHLGAETQRLRGHGQAPLDDEAGRPKFLKLLIEVEGGDRIAFTDGRRLGRLWLGEDPMSDPAISKLGFDVYTGLPPAKLLHERLRKRKAPIKAVLLDQGLFAGIGNWIADEVLYQARLAPVRLASSLSEAEVKALRAAISKVIRVSVSVEADKAKFPSEWLFHHRWGGDRGQDRIGGQPIVREQVGGRTTAWVPSRQR
jgi:formamidopyrimidine-DNA glycosylase